jgi:hypothetical protein
MKYILYLFLLFTLNVQAQVNEPVKIEATKTPPIYGKYKIQETTYTVYQGSKGGLYIIRVSGKTGEPYKYYIPKEKQHLRTKE